MSIIKACYSQPGSKSAACVATLHRKAVSAEALLCWWELDQDSTRQFCILEVRPVVFLLLTELAIFLFNCYLKEGLILFFHNNVWFEQTTACKEISYLHYSLNVRYTKDWKKKNILYTKDWIRWSSLAIPLPNQKPKWYQTSLRPSLAYWRSQQGTSSKTRLKWARMISFHDLWLTLVRVTWMKKLIFFLFSIK